MPSDEDLVQEHLARLVDRLVRLPRETEWLEFKTNNCDPVAIGEYISALSNSCALNARPNAFLIWGVDDVNHDVVGTDFAPESATFGNEALENWLTRNVEPQLPFRFQTLSLADSRRVVLLEIPPATTQPVAFKGEKFVRVGSYKKKLREHPEHERRLWRAFDTTPFEVRTAASECSAAEVLRLLDYPAYFDMLRVPLPDNQIGILNALESDALIKLTEAGRWNITNFGAILLAKRLSDFVGLARKAVRVMHYRGTDRIETIREQVGSRGYAAGFSGLIAFITAQLPVNEIVAQALRRSVPVFPPLAVRELAANALVHQDFSLTGTGPTVEIFDDRIEITNPGKPLVDTERFVDTPPRSRNEALASFMRRVGICEERGSGWDKVVFETEFNQLPAPLAEVTDEHTRVVLFAPRALTRMDRADRIRAVYLHACLKYVTRDYLTNTSVRQRFGIEPQNSAMASRFIKEAIEAGRIAAHDATAAPRLMRYVPAWAASPTGT